jgi:hypothetical protein
MGAGVATGPHCLGGLPRASKGADPPAERFRARRRSRSSLVSRAPRQGAGPWRFASERGPKVPPGAERTRRLSGNSVGLRFRSAGPKGLGSRRKPFDGGGSFEPPFPRLADGLRGRPPRRLGSGWRGSGVAAFASSCRASAEAAAFTKPWLSPSCRCRGGFVSRPRLARAAPKGLPLRLWLKRHPIRFRTGRLWPRIEGDRLSDSGKGPPACG